MLSAEARRQQAMWELDRLINEYKPWAKEAMLPQYATQVESLSSEVLAVAKRLRESLSNLGAGGSVGNEYARCIRIEKQITWLWRAWYYFREKFDQRTDARFADTLKAADEVIWSCYRPAFTADLSQSVPEPAPLPYIEMEYSPVALRRNERYVLGKDATYELLVDAFQTLPIPIMKLPISSILNPWTLTFIGHEVGHFVHRLIGPKSEFVKAFRSTVEEAAGDAVWGAWSNEIFADWYSMLAMGPWAIWPLAQFDVGGTEMMSTRRDVYPAPLVRFRLLAALADRHGFAGSAMLAGLALDDPGAAAYPELDSDTAALDAVADAIVAVPECKDLCSRLDPRLDYYEEGGLVDQWSRYLRGAGAQPIVGKPSSARLAAAGSAHAWDILVFRPAHPPADIDLEPLRKRARSAMRAGAMLGVRSSRAPAVPAQKRAGDVLIEALDRIAGAGG